MNESSSSAGHDVGRTAVHTHTQRQRANIMGLAMRFQNADETDTNTHTQYTQKTRREINRVASTKQNDAEKKGRR